MGLQLLCVTSTMHLYLGVDDNSLCMELAACGRISLLSHWAEREGCEWKQNLGPFPSPEPSTWFCHLLWWFGLLGRLSNIRESVKDPVYFQLIYVFFPSLQVKDDLGYCPSRVFQWYNDRRISGRERRIPANWRLNFAEEKCYSPKKMVGKLTFPFYLMAFLLVVLWSTHTKQRIRNLGLVEGSLGLNCWNSDCFLLLLLYKWKEKKEKSRLRYGQKKINLSPFSVLIQSTYTWLIHIMA